MTNTIVSSSVALTSSASTPEINQANEDVVKAFMAHFGITGTEPEGRIIEEPENYTMVKRINGRVKYYNAEGQLHRLDGPAVVGDDGHMEWWVNGQHHRVGGPAVVYSDGCEEWLQNGKLHNTEGFAIVYEDGSGEIWEHGQRGRHHRV